MTLCRCGDPVPVARYSLGHRSCMACGEQDARRETEAKGRSVVPSHHKGGFTYVNPATVKDYVQQVSSRAPRREGVEIPSSPTIRTAPKLPAPEPGFSIGSGKPGRRRTLTGLRAGPNGVLIRSYTLE